MLDQLLKMITSQGEQDVVNNPAIPNELNSKVMGEAGSSIMNGLQQVLAGGGLSQVMALLGGRSGGGGNNLAGLMGNPMVQNIVHSFVGRLTGQYNLNPAVAQQVGDSLIPNVLSQLSQRVADPADNSMDFNSVIRSLAGGQLGDRDFNGLGARMAQGGLDRDGDGDVDLQDLSGMVSQAAGSQSGGGFMDMIGKMMR